MRFWKQSTKYSGNGNLRAPTVPWQSPRSVKLQPPNPAALIQTKLLLTSAEVLHVKRC